MILQNTRLLLELFFASWEYLFPIIFTLNFSFNIIFETIVWISQFFQSSCHFVVSILYLLHRPFKCSFIKILHLYILLYCFLISLSYSFFNFFTQRLLCLVINCLLTKWFDINALKFYLIILLFQVAIKSVCDYIKAQVKSFTKFH